MINYIKMIAVSEYVIFINLVETKVCYVLLVRNMAYFHAIEISCKEIEIAGIYVYYGVIL